MQAKASPCPITSTSGETSLIPTWHAHANKIKGSQLKTNSPCALKSKMISKISLGAACSSSPAKILVKEIGVQNSGRSNNNVPWLQRLSYRLTVQESKDLWEKHSLHCHWTLSYGISYKFLTPAFEYYKHQGRVVPTFIAETLCKDRDFHVGRARKIEMFHSLNLSTF